MVPRSTACRPQTHNAHTQQTHKQNSERGAAYDFQLEDRTEYTGLADRRCDHYGNRYFKSVHHQIFGGLPPHRQKL